MSGKELLKIALANGYTVDRINGSHYIVIKESQTIAIPVHGNKDIPIGTLNKILKLMGLK